MNITKYNSPFAENAKRIIEISGKKQCVLAKEAGYTTQEFNAMLNGRKVIKAIDVLRFARVLNVSPNELFKSIDTKQAS